MTKPAFKAAEDCFPLLFCANASGDLSLSLVPLKIQLSPHTYLLET